MFRAKHLKATISIHFMLPIVRIFFFLLVLWPVTLQAQMQDSLAVQEDSVFNRALHHADADSTLVKILADNTWLNSGATPVALQQIPRIIISKDWAFYVLVCMLLILGFLKMGYARYFNNLVRVFFNTSLRQSQLTDQLLQAKLPSMLFNAFFVLIAGYYVFILMVVSGKATFLDWNYLPVCILAVLLIYASKYLILKFVGWLTGFRQQSETYIFIVFLINKIIALAMVPIVIILTFSQKNLLYITVVSSFILIGLLMLMRFFRSYGLLQSSLKVSRFHFLLYIIGIEILPLLLIYKSAISIIVKNV